LDQNYLQKSIERIHTGEIKTLCYINDGRTLLSGGKDSSLAIIDILTYKYDKVSSLNGKVLTGEVTSICNGNDGIHIFYSVGNSIATLDLRSRKLVGVYEGNHEKISSMVWLKEYRILICSRDSDIFAINPFENTVQFSLSQANPTKNLVVTHSETRNKFILFATNYSDMLLSFALESPTSIVSLETINYSSKIVNLLNCYDNKSIAITLEEGIWYLKNIDKDFQKKKFYQQCPYTSSCFIKDGLTFVFANDQEILEFLGKEIKYEKERQQAPSKLKGFEITSSNGAEVVLTKKQQNETIVVRLNVNNSVDDENAPTFEEEGSKEPKEAEPKMVSRPSFIVEISKGGNTSLAIQCAFPAADVDMQAGGEEEEQYADLIEIEEVALLSKGKEWDEKIYVVSGPTMDGTMYDMLLNMLEERGVDGDFVEQLVSFSTAYEHNHYVSFLEQLKDFVGSK